MRGDYLHVGLHLERAKAALAGVLRHSNEEARSLEAEWLVMQSLDQYMQGHPAESKSLATRALELVPETNGLVRSLAYYALASGNWLEHDYTEAAATFQKAIRYGRAAENLVAEMMSTVGLALMAFERGQLHLAFDSTKPVIDRIEAAGLLHPITGILYGLLGEVCYQWHQIEEARHYSLRALQLSALGGYNTAAILCRVFLSRLEQLDGNLEAAATLIQEAADLVPAKAPGYVLYELTAQQVHIHLARNRIDKALMALQGHGFSLPPKSAGPTIEPGQSISHSIGLLNNSSLLVLLHQGRTTGRATDLAAGIELASRTIEGALRGPYTIVAIEALLLSAQMHATLATLVGDPAFHVAASQADYRRALQLGEPETFIGVFVAGGPPVAGALANLLRQNRLGTVEPAYVERILAAYSDTLDAGQSARQPAETVEPPALVEPLTDRELDVLRLMAEGLKYREIAARLFITMNTVRFHVKAIYGKLGVNNRTQAIQRAHQLQLL